MEKLARRRVEIHLTFTIEFNLLQQKNNETNYNLQSGDLLI